MKRMLALMLCLVLLSVSALAAIGANLHAERDQVLVTERVIFGDRAMANGLRVNAKFHYGYHLLWNTHYTVGSNSDAKTEYDFFSREKYDQGTHSYRGVILDVDIPQGCDFGVPAEEQSGLGRVYKEMYDAAPFDLQVTRTVHLKDFYDYYPVGIHMDLPGVSWTGNNPESLPNDGSAGSERAVWEAFQRFFKIPMSDREVRELSLTKYRSGSISIGSGWTGADQATFHFSSNSTYVKNTCFFTVNNRMSDGTLMDMSQVPGGYGIYSFDFVYGHGIYQTGISPASLATVYPLEEHVIVHHITADAAGENLLLFTVENGQSVLSVIDIASMTCLQRLELGEKSVETIYEAEDFLVLEMGGTELSVVAPNQGIYELCFAVPTARCLGVTEQYMDTNTVTMAFDGERLAVVDGLRAEQYFSYRLCGFYVAVYQKDGLCYYGEYDSSLSVNPSPQGYQYQCQPYGSCPFEAAW